MVHIRLNDPDTARSPHINFVRALKQLPDSDEAQRRLEQIAALFRPVMKDYGFTVNSLEEVSRLSSDWFSQQAET